MFSRIYNDQDDTRASSAHVTDAFDTLIEAKNALWERAYEYTKEYISLGENATEYDYVEYTNRGLAKSGTEWWFESEMNMYDYILIIQKIDL